jgi:hypothetical protein
VVLLEFVHHKSTNKSYSSGLVVYYKGIVPIFIPKVSVMQSEENMVSEPII